MYSNKPIQGAGLEPEYAEAFNAWKTLPNPQTSGALIKKIQPTLGKAVSAYVTNPTTAAHTQAKLLALKSLGNYDPARGVKLNTYLMNQLQGLRRISRQQQQIIRVPERISLEQRVVHDANLELSDNLGREPTTGELADYTGLSMKRLGTIRKYAPPMSEGQMLRVEDEDTPQLPAIVSGKSRKYAELLYHDLDPAGQKILEHTLGLFGSKELSNNSIAKKLRLTPGAVSQRKSKLQQQLHDLESSNIW